jgi:hypothetical protein
MIDYSLILITNYPNKQWILTGYDYNGLDWHDESPKPTQAELDALWEFTQAKVLADKQTAESHRQSAINKLKALGLTDDEVAALKGTV